MHGIASLLMKTQLEKKKKLCSECQRHYVEMSQYRKRTAFSTHQAAKHSHTSLFNFISDIESDLQNLFQYNKEIRIISYIR